MSESGQKKRIALVLPALDIAGGGGTERQFADAFDAYQDWKDARYELFLVVDRHSHDELKGLGKPRHTDRVICLGGLRDISRVRTGSLRDLLYHPDRLLREIRNKILRKVELALVTKRGLAHADTFDLVHVCQPYYLFLPLLRHLGKRGGRPKITMNVVDCSVAHDYLSHPAGTATMAYSEYFNHVRLDGIYSWYQLFKDVAERHDVVRSRPPIVAARACFTDTSRFTPSDKKQNVVVYACRMEEQKRPLFFVEGVRMARTLNPGLVKNWRFEMYGTGSLERDIRDAIETRDLSHVITMDYRKDMSSVLATSKLFVSTQDYENFTSLSMMEAMASGNAVIARDVGQTRLFVKDQINGLLLDEDSPAGLAHSLLVLLEKPEAVEAMGRASVRIVTEQHSTDNFLGELEGFWSQVLEMNTRRVSK